MDSTDRSSNPSQEGGAPTGVALSSGTGTGVASGARVRQRAGGVGGKKTLRWWLERAVRSWLARQPQVPEGGRPAGSKRGVVYRWGGAVGEERFGMVWSPGAERRTDGGESRYPGPGWLVAYRSAELAALLRPAYSASPALSATLWRCQADVGTDWLDRVGCTWLRAEAPTEVPAIDESVRVRFASLTLRHTMAVARARAMDADDAFDLAARGERSAARRVMIAKLAFGWSTVPAVSEDAGPGQAPSRLVDVHRVARERLQAARETVMAADRRLKDIRYEYIEHLREPAGNMRATSCAQRVAWAAEQSRDMSYPLDLHALAEMALGKRPVEEPIV